MPILTNQASRFLGGGRFAPNKLAGLALWLKADAITGLADGAAIGTWADSSGNGRNATQATAGAKPTYKTGILNGLPVARFDGGDDFMTVADADALEAAAMTIFAVANATVDRDFEGLLDKWSSNFGWMIDFSSVANRGKPRISVGITSGVTWTASVSGAWAIIGAVVNGAASKIGANGAYATGSLSGTITNSDALTIAGDGVSTLALSADIAEIIIYDSALSDANRQAVERYLSAKYAIALA